MAESKYNQIMAALIARFESIESDNGTTWHYTPSKVIRYAAFTNDCLDDSIAGEETTLYVLVDKAEESEPMTQGPSGHERKVMALDVVLARRFATPERPFEQASPTRQTVQDRLIRDCQKALLKDTADGNSSHFSGLALGVEVGEADRTAENTYHEGWAIAFQPARILYSHPVSTP